MKYITFTLLTLFSLLLAACASTNGDTTQTPPTTIQPPTGQNLTVMTHDSFSISEEELAKFEQSHNVSVQFLKAGDTGSALNKAILAKDAPLADVFYGVDNTFLSRALQEDIFESYASPSLANIPAEFRVDAENRLLPVDYGDVCLNYDIQYFTENNLPPPQSLDDLAQEQYRGLFVMQNPATSSPGLAFLFTTIGQYGEDGYLDYWQKLKDNGMKVVNDWESAYYTEFSRWGGAYPIVVSYSSSPAFEVIYAEEPMDAPLSAAVTSPGACFRQIELAGILKSTQNRALAEAWIDFMLSPDFQADLPLQMFVFPVLPDVEVDARFEQFLVHPEQTAQLDAAEIAAKREAWITAWTDLVLR